MVIGQFGTCEHRPLSLMKRARDDDDVRIVRVVRSRQASCCGLLDWLPPEMRSHVRSFLGLRNRYRLHRVCHLLNEEDAQPFHPPILAFLSSTGDDRSARRRFWRCVDVLDKAGVTAWPEFAHLHIDHGFLLREWLHSPRVFYWRYLAYAEHPTELFQVLRITLTEPTILDLLRGAPLHDFDVVYTSAYGAISSPARPFILAAHREWLRKTIADNPLL